MGIETLKQWWTFLEGHTQLLAIAVVVVVALATMLRWGGNSSAEAETTAEDARKAPRSRRFVAALIALLALGVLFASIGADKQDVETAVRKSDEGTKQIQRLEKENSTLAVQTKGQVAQIASLQQSLEDRNKTLAVQANAAATLAAKDAELAAFKDELAKKADELNLLRAQTEAERATSAKAISDVQAALRAALEKSAQVTTQSGTDVKIDFKDALLFSEGSPEVVCSDPSMRDALGRLAASIAFRAAHGKVQIQIVGHTDNTFRGAAKDAATYNQSLSEERAKAVQSYLVAIGLPPEMISAKGMGMRQPYSFKTEQADKVIRDANADESKRRRNRRVEVFVEEAK